MYFKYFIALIALILNSCAMENADYDVSVDDLVGHQYMSLDDQMKDGTFTTVMDFKSDLTFEIREDEYFIYPDHKEYLRTKVIPGYIEGTINTEYYQIIEFYIDNFIAPGWKTYRITDYNFGDYDCLMLIEVAEQNLGGGWEWVDMNVGDTTYLYDLCCQ